MDRARAAARGATVAASLRRFEARAVTDSTARPAVAWYVLSRAAM